MEIIELHHPYQAEEIPQDDIVLILGFFDGLHMAHQKVIQEGLKLGRQHKLKVGLMTFKRSPRIVYSKFRPEMESYLTPRKRKRELLADFGIDRLFEVDFTSEFSALKPEEFVDQYVLGLNAKHVVAGYDYTFGPPKQTSMELMRQLAAGRFGVHTVQPVLDRHGEAIHASRIRGLLSQGKIEIANELLGYPYENTGFVIHGESRGRVLGFPTANTYPDPEQQFIPGIGVYACQVLVQGQWYQAATSIGYNLTFGKSDSYTIEPYILDFDREIYGEDIRIRWLHFLREEIKFNSVDALIDQLEKDEAKTRQLLR